MANGRGALGLLKSFNFVDKDPACDEFRTLYQKVGIKEHELATLANLATSTVKAMFGGKTRKPQHLTFCKLAAAMGKKYALVDVGEIDYEKEIPKAKLARKEYLAALKKKRERKERAAA